MAIEKRSGGTLSPMEGNKIRGYAAVYGPLSEDLGGFYERVGESAFTSSLQAGKDIRAFMDHDSSKVLGRTSAGTLKLFSDARGLGVEIDLPETTYAADLRTLMTRGDINQMSFAFLLKEGGDSWESAEGRTIRTLTDVELIEVSVVSIPAYPDTTAAVRSRQADQDKAFMQRLRQLWILKNRYK